MGAIEGQQVFELKRILSVENIQLSARTQASAKQIVALVTQNGDLILYYTNGDSPAVLRRVPWFLEREKRITSLAFHPAGSWLLVTGWDGFLHIVPTLSLVDPKSVSDQSWNPLDLTSFPSVTTSPPTCCVWWQSTALGHQMGLVGTESGDITLINLNTGQRLGTRKISGSLSMLHICHDNSDSAYLLMTCEDRQQWRVLLEDRDGSWFWPEEPGRSSSRVLMREEINGLSPAPSARSRLQGLKQMSVEKLAIIRQRLAETRSKTTSSNLSTSSNVTSRRGSGSSDGSARSSDASTPSSNTVPQVENLRWIVNAFLWPQTLRGRQTLQRGNKDCQQRRIILARQQIFINEMVKLVKMVARESGNRIKKIERLQSLLVDSETFMINFSNIEPLPFPLNPDIYIKGIVAESATLFKSALMPSRLTFLTTDNTEYVAIFKHGDDLRQDQLILQSISLMDKLLRRENLDLKLTPYRVLATSTKHGFVQFIDSMPVAEVLASDGSIQNFFRKHHPMETAPYGIQPEIIDNYVRSCAGYCVITYILGVGDRHLDNLLLTSDGKLFHIDFGFILGRDPKPLPPPIKLSKEMVEAMGGTESDHYHEFRKQCYTAFLHLRRHANLILNLFSLMVDASVPDIALEPDKAVKKVQDKLRLDLSDEEAVHYMQTVLDVSVTAVIAVMVEQFHKIAQYWRK